MAGRRDDPDPPGRPAEQLQPQRGCESRQNLAVGLARPLKLERPSLRLPLAGESVAAGFPSPADDYIDSGIDLNEALIRHPSSTFFLRVSGDSMVGAGIQDGDLLVVDRSL
ncbi:MAG: LexA family protein, partial [Cyanobium sp.]